MRKNIILALVVVLVAVFGLMVSQVPALAKAKYQIKLHHGEPLGSAEDLNARKLKAMIEEKTQGEAEVSMYPAGEMGTDLEAAEMIQMGTLQMAIVATGWLGGISPAAQILDIPFLLPTDSRLAVKVLNGPAGDALGATFKGMKVTGYYSLGVKQYTCNNAIRKPADFKGLKIRTMASPLVVESFKVMGAIPTPLPYTEVYSALQLGTVVGQENPIWAIKKMKFYEVQDYLILSNHATFVSMMAVNPKWFDSLPPKIQKIIADGSKEIAYPIYESIAKEEQADLDEIRASGTQIIELTPAEIGAFKEAMVPVRKKFVELTGKQELLKIFDEEVAKVTK